MAFGRLVFVLAVAPGCFAEDSIDFVCHERARAPAVLPIDQAVELSLELSCDEDLSVSGWDLVAPPRGLGPPSESTTLTADRAQGREFRLVGTFTARSYVDLEAIRVSAVGDDRRNVLILRVDWSAP